MPIIRSLSKLSNFSFSSFFEYWKAEYKFPELISEYKYFEENVKWLISRPLSLFKYLYDSSYLPWFKSNIPEKQSDILFALLNLSKFLAWDVEKKNKNNDKQEMYCNL